MPAKTAKKSVQFCHDPNFPLPPLDQTVSPPRDVLESIAEHVGGRGWILEHTADLRVGDVCFLRHMVPASRGRGSQGERVVGKTLGHNSRVVVVLEPWIAICEVDRVYAKKTARNATMVNFRVLWDNAQGGSSRPAVAFSQATIVSENEKPIGRRKTEVWRLRNSGPTSAERASTTAIAHSIAARHERFIALWETVSTTATVRAGSPFVKPPEVAVPPTEDEIASWTAGQIEVPSWVMNVLIRQSADDERFQERLAATQDEPVQNVSEPLVEASPETLRTPEPAPAVQDRPTTPAGPVYLHDDDEDFDDYVPDHAFMGSSESHPSTARH